MLICIADSEYFNIALKAYINEPNSKPLDIKEILCYPFSGQSEMFYTFFATDAGARLSTILIDYSSVSIEVLQVALSLKSFKEVAIKWSAAPDMTPQTVLYRRPVAQFSNFQPKIVSSWLILALFQANFLISGRSRLCPYQLVNSNQVRQGE